MVNFIVQGQTVTVTSNPTGIITAGSSVILTCTVEFNAALESPVTVNVVWTGPAGFVTANIAQPIGNMYTTYISTVTINPLGREHSGNYTCTATSSSTSLQATRTSGSLRVTVGKL